MDQITLTDKPVKNSDSGSRQTDNWGVNVYMFVFTDRTLNNRSQKKLEEERYSISVISHTPRELSVCRRQKYFFKYFLTQMTDMTMVQSFTRFLFNN